MLRPSPEDAVRLSLLEHLSAIAKQSSCAVFAHVLELQAKAGAPVRAGLGVHQEGQVGMLHCARQSIRPRNVNWRLVHRASVSHAPSKADGEDSHDQRGAALQVDCYQLMLKAVTKGLQ